MYCLFSNDIFGNQPVRSVYVVSLCWSANAAQQKMWFASLVSCFGKKSVSSPAGTSLMRAFCGMFMLAGTGILMVGLGRVDRTPAGVFFMWPLAVVVEVGRYFLTASDVRPGHDANWLLVIALIHVDGGGLKAH